MKPHSEELLERLVFDFGVAIAEAESGRGTEEELRKRMAALCRKWRGDIETLITTASDPAVSTAARMYALQTENTALREELDTAKRENAGLKTENAELLARPPEKKAKAPPPPAAEEPQEKSEFGDAMKGVKRY